MSSYHDIALCAPMRKPGPMPGSPPLASSGRGLAPTWSPWPPLASSGGGLAPAWSLRLPLEEAFCLLSIGRPAILKLNGMALSDFGSHSEALKTADELIAMNKERFGHSGEKREHPKMPLLSTFFYVSDEGKRRCISQTEHKSLTAASALKTKRQVEEATGHVQVDTGSKPSTSVKEEASGNVLQIQSKLADLMHLPQLLG